MLNARAGVRAGLLVLAASLAPSAHAQPAAPPPATPPAEPAEPSVSGPSWSLGSVLEHAVRHSPRLASARIDVTVAEARVLEATGIEDWLLGAAGTYYRRRAEASADNVTGTDEIDQYTAQASISKLLWTGGRVSLTAEGQRNETVFVFGGGGKAVETSTALTARIDQPLFRGRGEAVTRAERTRAQLAADAARLDKETAARTLIRDLIAAYWEVAYATADLEIRKSSLVLARERRRLTEASARGGATAPTEIVAVDQVIAGREEEIVVAELQIAERSLELRRLAGIEIAPDQIDIRVDTPLAAAPTPLELESVVEQAFQKSPEIAALELRGRGAALEVSVARSGLLPRLDLNLYGGPLGVDTDLSGAIEQTAKGDGYQVGGGLELEHALGRNTAHGVARRAAAERDRVRVDMADVRAQIAQAAVQAVTLARTAERRMQLSKTAIELSEKNIKAEVGRFELGKSTNFDVLARQEELKQARLRYARAATDYLRASAFLAALTGEILPQYGIKLD